MAAQDGGPVMPLELTDEERAVLRECRVNSLYFRGIPLGTVSVLLTREIIKWGYLPKAKRFAGLYYSGMFAVGLFAGIGSYRKACMDKIMRLENSNLANQVREFYKKAGIQEGYGAEQNLSTSDEFGEHKSVFQESLPLTQSPSQELRSDNTESAWPLAHPDDLKATGKTYTSYEDLRKQNRNQWATPQQHPRRDNNLQGAQHPAADNLSLSDEVKEYHSPADSYSMDDSPSTWISDDAPTSKEETPSPSSGKWPRPRMAGPPLKPKNQYGDDME
ncbi:OCIA domain-containing protein 1 [Nematostella vectensis]|uniref:OCIA domain-containing protein 1 n=1 Tax=Nematostella vectensis TaxID=45351 RepID=UPI0013900462|nr:OCIA domain-containing protein 1 [Nematostella vectensis]